MIASGALVGQLFALDVQPLRTPVDAVTQTTTVATSFAAVVGVRVVDLQQKGRNSVGPKTARWPLHEHLTQSFAARAKLLQKETHLCLASRRRYLRSSSVSSGVEGLTNVVAVPVLPLRPVRPI